MKTENGLTVVAALMSRHCCLGRDMHPRLQRKKQAEPSPRSGWPVVRGATAWSAAFVFCARRIYAARNERDGPRV